MDTRQKAISFAKHGLELVIALRRLYRDRSLSLADDDAHRHLAEGNLLEDLESSLQATVEVLEDPDGPHKHRRVGGLGYCGRKDRGGCAAVDTLDDGSVLCMFRGDGCLPIKTDWRTYD